ncbi:hypothetical protein ACFL29_01150 [Patescibacteria group bacterium]
MAHATIKPALYVNQLNHLDAKGIDSGMRFITTLKIEPTKYFGIYFGGSMINEGMGEMMFGALLSRGQYVKFGIGAGIGGNPIEDEKNHWRVNSFLRVQNKDKFFVFVMTSLGEYEKFAYLEGSVKLVGNFGFGLLADTRFGIGPRVQLSGTLPIGATWAFGIYAAPLYDLKNNAFAGMFGFTFDLY